MSAGNFSVRTNGQKRRELLEEAVAADLDTDRDVKVDENHDLPYLAGYSKDGRTIYIDRHLAKEAPEIDGQPYSVWRAALIEHEASEKETIDEGFSYDEAHIRVATPREHAVLRLLRMQPGTYERELRPFIKAAEHEKIVKPPADLDCTPYKDNDALSRRLLSHLRLQGCKDAKNAKKSHVEVNYGASNGQERCGNCRYFAKPHCELVVDPIQLSGWCKLWDRAPLVN